MTGFIGLWPMTVNDKVGPLRGKNAFILVDRKGLLFHWQSSLGESKPFRGPFYPLVPLGLLSSVFTLQSQKIK